MAARVVGGNGRTVNPYQKHEDLPEDSEFRRRRRPWHLYEMPQQPPPPDLQSESDKMRDAIHAGFEQTQYLPEADRIAIERTAWRVSTVARPDADLERSFRELAEKWRKDTLYTSSITSMVIHPAYQRIIGIGPEAIPMILRELQHRPAQWFWALRSITGEDPVDSEDAGRVRKMTEAWLNWGRKRGYL